MGSPWNYGQHRVSEDTRMMGVPGRERNLTVSLAFWIQYTNVPDGGTDRRTPSDK